MEGLMLGSFIIIMTIYFLLDNRRMKMIEIEKRRLRKDACDLANEVMELRFRHKVENNKPSLDKLRFWCNKISNLSDEEIIELTELVEEYLQD